MNIAAMIPRRRSVRAYRAERLDNTTLADLLRYMEGLVLLIPGVKVEGRIIPTDHGSFLQKRKTPHFIAIFSDGSDDGLLNAGFMYQQLDLYAQSLGLGTCWVGLGSLTEAEPVPEGMKLAVMMAIGRPDGVPERTAADFKRKPMKELSDRPDDRLEVLRLAPSATNSQPWFVTHDGDTLHIWREELGRIKQRTHGRMKKSTWASACGICMRPTRRATVSGAKRTRPRWTGRFTSDLSRCDGARIPRIHNGAGCFDVSGCLRTAPRCARESTL